MLWVQLAIAILQTTSRLISWAQQQGYVQQGRDEQIAQISAEILCKTSTGKAILAKVAAMSEKEVDDALAALEPKPTAKS